MGACQFKQEFENDIVAGESLSAALQYFQQHQQPATTTLHQHHHHHHHHSDSPPKHQFSLDKLTLSPQAANQLILAYQLYQQTLQSGQPESTGGRPATQLALDSLTPEDIETLHQLILLQQQLKSVQQQQQAMRSSQSKLTGFRQAPSTSFDGQSAGYSSAASTPVQQYGAGPGDDSLSQEEQHKAVLAAVAARQTPMQKKSGGTTTLVSSTASSKSPYPSAPVSPTFNGTGSMMGFKSQKKLPTYGQSGPGGMVQRNISSAASSSRSNVQGGSDSGGGLQQQSQKKIPMLAAKQAIRVAEKQLWGAVVESEKQNEYDAITKHHFLFNYVIGRGGFGKVWKVEKKKTKKLYAMKEMSKARIIQKRSVNSVMNERKLLSQLKHPYLVNMSYAFQDQKNLYLIMDLLSGGDLRYHLAKRKRFTEQQTRFFIACIVTSLEYLHNNGILHRDVKPENLIFDNRGFLRLTDLGIARVWNPENAQDTSGTPGYMAPEVMCRQNHGVAVDYFATGVIAYECMMGRRPYLGRSRKEIRDQILAKQVSVKRHEIPEGWSLEAVNFINKMIQRKPMNRLGLNGPNQVKAHPWLRDFPWDDLFHKRLRASYVPNVSERDQSQPKEDNFDPRTCQDGWKDQEDPEIQKENQEMLRRKSIQELFQGYYYDYSMIQSRESYQSAAGIATPDSFTSATTSTTQMTKPTPLKASTKSISKTPSYSRPHSPVNQATQAIKSSLTLVHSATNSPKSAIGAQKRPFHGHSQSHSNSGSATPNYASIAQGINMAREKASFTSSFSRGFKGSQTGSLRGSILGREGEQRGQPPHHGYTSSANQSVMSKYLYKVKR